MGNIKLDLSRVYGVVEKSKIEALKGEAEAAIKTLHAGNGAGNDFLGWLNLPSSISEAEFAEIEAAAKDMRSRVDYVVVAGIGGSYLGARAVIEGLSKTAKILLLFMLVITSVKITSQNFSTFSRTRNSA